MKRILVVEDEPEIAVGLEIDLKTEGYEVEVTGDGNVASRRAREAAFDLILLDVMLPGKDGFEVCREWIAAFPGWRQTPNSFYCF